MSDPRKSQSSVTPQMPKPEPAAAQPAPSQPVTPQPAVVARKPEIGGPKGPEPTRYGDWEKGGRCVDF